MADLTASDATALTAIFRSGEASAAEIAEAHLKRMEATEPSLHCFVTIMRDEAMAQATALDEARSRGESAGPLAAVPVAVKDVLAVRGHPTTCGSRILSGFLPPYDATCVARIRAAGAVIVGKTNMDEFAMGSSTEHSAFGPTRNPWDLTRVPGGSSGGSAAAVASRQVPLALGTDTGGSIRQPAAFSGAVGLKPTYGRVSRFGLVAFASSLDQAGPLSRSVRDAAAALAIMAGPDARDMTAAARGAEDIAQAVSGKGGALSGLRVGVPEEFFGEGLDPEVDAAVKECLRAMEAGGAQVRTIAIPSLRFAIATYYIVATAEASSNLARFDGVRYGLRDTEAGTLAAMYDRTRQAGFGEEVKRRIMLGTYVLSAGYHDAYYLKAMQARGLIRRELETAFTECDVLVAPTTPTTAFRLGEKLDDPLAMYLADIFTVTANLAGLPAVSIPCGFSREGLPIGCQIIGRHFEESTILGAAAALEASLDAMDDAPPLAVDRR